MMPDDLTETTAVQRCTCARALCKRARLIFAALGIAAGIFVACGAQAAPPGSRDTDDDPALSIAVAANFSTTLHTLLDAFSQHYYYPQLQTRISVASTGTLYHQISLGAPHDLFFAADQRHPRELVDKQRARGLVNYAEGRLVLLVKDSIASAEALAGTAEACGADASAHSNRAVLASLLQKSTRLVIANPRTAPYGAASLQVLQQLDKEWPLKNRLHARNVMHAQQLFTSSDADAAFISLAQFNSSRNGQQYMSHPGCAVHAELHEPVRQYAVLLDGAGGRRNPHPAAIEMLEFVRSARGRSLIEGAGYSAPRPPQESPRNAD